MNFLIKSVLFCLAIEHGYSFQTAQGIKQTKVTSTVVKFMWAVDNINFYLVPGTGSSLDSGLLHLDVPGGYVNAGLKTFNPQILQLYFGQNKVNSYDDITVNNINITIMNVEGKINFSWKYAQTYNNKVKSNGVSQLSFNLQWKDALREVELAQKNTGSKTIIFLVEIYCAWPMSEEKVDKSEKVLIFASKSNFDQNITKKMWEDPTSTYCDLTIILNSGNNDEKIYCYHKLILLANDVRFLLNKIAMSTEIINHKTVIRIDGITSEIFEKMMEFFYTRKFDVTYTTLKDNLKEYYRAIHKIQSAELNDYIIDLIRANLTPDNSVEYYKFAIDNGFKELRTAILDFLRSQAAILSETRWYDIFDQIINNSKITN